ncbi:protein 5NUC-like isoform X4 [Helicoverpa zea]|uniref:protein 5NUC-like isoform X4 n=1 Tax=Helicoverpa zea TaxID=7113 RepID=UPI001F59D8D9|nr:protein 5NUC-like isoform X4 [Helicoverpa zea]
MKLLVATLLAVVAMASGNVLKPQGTFELLILHNNDMHAHFEQSSQRSGTCTNDDREAGKCYGGFPRVAHVVKQAREAALNKSGPPVLYLNAGDTYTGTAWFTIYKWKIAAEFVNALQPDAVSLGNHEFDNGVSGLIPFIHNLTCPVLAANLILTNEPELQAEPNLMESVVLDKNGTKIGVIGYLTPDTKFLAQRNYVDYIDEVTAIRKQAAILKSNGVNILIALGHSGFITDVKIAKEVEDIDIVIGAHTHTFLWNDHKPDLDEPQGLYPTMVEQHSGKIVPVVQAYAYTKYLGKLHVIFNSDGEIINSHGNPILLNNSIPQDPTVLEIVNTYSKNMVAITETIIGNTSVYVDGQTCRLKECNMGNFISDAIIYKYASVYRGQGWTDAPIAIIHSGGIRSSFNKVEFPSFITKGDLIRVMPFDGVLVKLTVSGDTILKMLEYSIHSYNPKDPTGKFLQMSGMRVKYDIGKPPNKRVMKVAVRCGECLYPEYSALNKTKTYNILIPAFLANGGDSFTMLENLPITDIGINQIESTEAFIKTHSPLYPAVEGRIILENTGMVDT